MTRADDPSSPDGQEEDPAPFGSQEPTRIAADVAYHGRLGEHDYLVRVRHRLLDTSITLEIDGVPYDPKDSQADKKDEGAEEDEGADVEEAEGDVKADVEGDEEAEEGDVEEVEGDKKAEQAGDPADAADADVDAADADTDPADGDLRFRLEEHFTKLYCTVRRPDEDGDHEDAEVITVRTAGLGGAGEVDVRQGLTRRPLAPDEDSPSAVRDRKRTAHPTRYALLAALTRAAVFLIPLLGIGALFSGLLRPVRDWVARIVRTIVEAVTGVIDPILEWIDELTRPVREFVEELTRPVREFISSLLQPLRDLLDWLRGLVPDLSVSIDVPEWVVDIAVPVIIVLVVFVLTYGRLRRRRERLEEARASSAPSATPPGDAERDSGGQPPADESGPTQSPSAEGSGLTQSPSAEGPGPVQSPSADESGPTQSPSADDEEPPQDPSP